MAFEILDDLSLCSRHVVSSKPFWPVSLSVTKCAAWLSHSRRSVSRFRCRRSVCHFFWSRSDSLGALIVSGRCCRSMRPCNKQACHVISPSSMFCNSALSIGRRSLKRWIQQCGNAVLEHVISDSGISQGLFRKIVSMMPR